MNTIIGDLHIHTIYSDGKLYTNDIINLLIKNNIKYASITDHDTFEAYKSIDFDQTDSLTIIPGIELSCLYMRKDVHILGYFKKTKDFGGVFNNRVNDRKERAEKILKCLSRKGIQIDINELKEEASPSTVLGRPHVARLMVKKGYAKTFNEVFIKYIGDKSECNIEKRDFSIKETIDLIKDLGGIAILAHPGLSGLMNDLDEFLNKGIDGIEVYNSDDIMEVEALKQYCLKNKILITGGSDFHGNENYKKRGIQEQYMNNFLDVWRLL